METVTESQQPRAAAADPWRLGWRYVQHKEADGSMRLKQVPLTERDLLFPQLGDFIVNRTPHHEDLGYLYGVFGQRLLGEADTVVLGDCRVDFNLPGVEPLGPEVIVLRGSRRKSHDWGTFDIRAEGARPMLVIEITSKDTRGNDFGIKRDYYEQAAVAYYAIVDVKEDETGSRALRLIGWRRTPSGWEELTPNDRGWLWLEPVQMWLGTVPADEEHPYVRVACYESGGDRINRWVEDVRARAAAEERADAERVRADAEAQARAALEERLQLMEAELRRLRGES